MFVFNERKKEVAGTRSRWKETILSNWLLTTINNNFLYRNFYVKTLIIPFHSVQNLDFFFSVNSNKENKIFCLYFSTSYRKSNSFQFFPVRQYWFYSFLIDKMAPYKVILVSLKNKAGTRWLCKNWKSTKAKNWFL